MFGAQVTSTCARKPYCPARSGRTHLRKITSLRSALQSLGASVHHFSVLSGT
jgi:hypothetical protein